MVRGVGQAHRTYEAWKDCKNVRDSSAWVWWISGGVLCLFGGCMAFIRRRRRALRAISPTARDVARVAALAREWAAVDPDPQTREIVLGWASSMRETGSSSSSRRSQVSPAFVLERLASEAHLRFGTAGLRAEMGPGYDRMNAYTVMTATQGVVTVMQLEEADKLCREGVAIGYDGRHGSEGFAAVAAAVFIAKGIKVRLFKGPVPTPLVAFSVLHYDLAGSIVITASHNPPCDNGYKLYWSNGSQILSPRDADIEHAIRANSRPWMKYQFDISAVRSSPLVQDPTQDCLDAYISEATRKLHWCSDADNFVTDAVVYTACHGVGYPFVSRLFRSFNLPAVIPVEEQTLRPDPKFSTLPKPNPEEKDALSLAIAKANSCGARIILANDPDADRLGAAEVIPETGNVRTFSGDEIAVLLADFLLLRYPNNRSDIAVVASTVSSKMLASIARAEGFVFCEANTGFKWLSHEASRLKSQNKNVILVYEEAIGFMIGDVVLDKDGVSAAAVFAEMAGYWSARGETLTKHLESLCKRYGFHLSFNGYLSLTESSTKLQTIFDEARRHGFPNKLGDCDVISVRDLTAGTDTSTVDGRSTLPADPKTQFVTLTCRSPLIFDGHDAPADVVVSLRGSGTEPKVKHYAELRCSEEHVRSGEGQKYLKGAVRDAVEKILKPSRNNLKSIL